ncbi:hypothetical protein [Shewanella baltica]|uniref:hypothetical protein n=1 Tax=Shewanella baltica TaxID=62322 RepID=UPI0024B97EF1|nr:hypothetical protein [Shewanella baltica]
MSTKPKSNLIDQSLTQAYKDFFSDIAELAIDSTLKKIVTEEELLRELPIIKWMVAGNKIKNSIQNAHFLKKYASFIGQISADHITTEDVHLLKEDALSAYDFEKIIDNTLIYIDRYHDELKAKLLGQLFFETFVSYRFTVDEYNSLMFSIESIHPFEGLPRLKAFYELKLQMDEALNDKDKRKIWTQMARLGYQPLAMSGLLNLPIGGSYVGSLGGASINEIGIKFYRYVVQKVID